MTEEEKIALARSIIERARKSNHFLKVVFTKKDGTERVLIAHRAKLLEQQVAEEPDGATVKRRETNHARNNLVVEEQTKNAEGEIIHQWRTIRLAAVKSITYGGETVAL